MEATPLSSFDIYTASTWVIPVLLAITLHEAAHGFVAHLCGDDTALKEGRVSFNPLKHVRLERSYFPPSCCFRARRSCLDMRSRFPPSSRTCVTSGAT
jgi:hypothetical protein